MRASNFGRVVATGCCLLWPVTAQIEPSNIQVQPPTLTENGSYTVSWEDDPSRCFIAGVYLTEVGTGSTVQTLLPTSSCGSSTEVCVDAPVNSAAQLASGVASSILNPSRVYQIKILWAARSGVDPSNATPTAGSTLSVSPLSVSQPATPGSGTAQHATGSPLPSLPSQSLATASAATSATRSVTASLSTPTATPSATSIANIPGVASDSSSLSLSTGAKAGIGIGAVGFALLVLIAALLIWRRSRQRQLRALPTGMPYSHEIGSTNRDLTAEKEMHVINSPVDTLHNGYSSIRRAEETQSQPARGSWAAPDAHTAAVAAVPAVPYTDAHRGSYGSGYDNSASPAQESQAYMPPAAAGGAAVQRKPVGAASGPTHHLREPGMTDEEVARLEEEERRLDEAIAEAERRRQVQG